MTTIANILGGSATGGGTGSSALSSALLGSSQAVNPAEATGSQDQLGYGQRKNVWNEESLRGALGI